MPTVNVTHRLYPASETSPIYSSGNPLGAATVTLSGRISAGGGDLSGAVEVLTPPSFGSVDSVSDSLLAAFTCPSWAVYDWGSPIWEFNGHIYFVYVRPRASDNNGYTYIAKMDLAGNVVGETQLDPDYYTPDNANHTQPSVGIDRDGYIHVAYRMHNSPYDVSSPWGTGDNFTNAWQYLVSDAPEDISSFTYRGNSAPPSPNGWISYPYFLAARNGQLFLTNRQRVKYAGWVPGTQAAGLHKYNEDTQTWTEIGEDVADGYPAFIYEPNGGENGGGYNSMRSLLFFDTNDRLHITCVFNASGDLPGDLERGECLIYAYSDDYGENWRRADGSPISLPLNHQNADLLDQESDGSYKYTLSFVGVNTQGHPVVSARKDHYGGSPYNAFWRWTGSSWEGPLNLPSTVMPARMFTDDAGFMWTMDSQQVWLSEDDGDNWTAYPIATGDWQTQMVDIMKVRDGSFYYVRLTNNRTRTEVRLATVTRS